MSTTIRNKGDFARSAPLAPRAVRARNVWLRAIARKRGLREPADAELALLQPHMTLSAAVRWWEQVQREEGPAQDVDADSLASEPYDILVRALAMSVLIVFALLAFPSEAGGNRAGLIELSTACPSP